MTKRARVVGAVVLGLVGGVFEIMAYLGGSDLHAAGVAEVGYDLTKVFVWVGVALLVGSALFFVSASAD